MRFGKFSVKGLCIEILANNATAATYQGPIITEDLNFDTIKSRSKSTIVTFVTSESHKFLSYSVQWRSRPEVEVEVTAEGFEEEGEEHLEVEDEVILTVGCES